MNSFKVLSTGVKQAGSLFLRNHRAKQSSFLLASNESTQFCNVHQRFMSSIQSKFAEAKERSTTLKEDPGNEVKLQMYALFKQSTEGKVNTSRPGMTNFVGRFKWDAWNSLGDMSKEEAQQAYIDLVEGLIKAEGGAEPEAASQAQYTCLLSECVMQPPAL